MKLYKSNYRTSRNNSAFLLVILEILFTHNRIEIENVRVYIGNELSMISQLFLTSAMISEILHLISHFRGPPQKSAASYK